MPDKSAAPAAVEVAVDAGKAVVVDCEMTDREKSWDGAESALLAALAALRAHADGYGVQGFRLRLIMAAEDECQAAISLVEDARKRILRGRALSFMARGVDLAERAERSRLAAEDAKAAEKAAEKAAGEGGSE